MADRLCEKCEDRPPTRVVDLPVLGRAELCERCAAKVRR